MYQSIPPSVIHIHNVGKPQKEKKEARNESSGSGFIISPDDYLIISHHVAADAGDLYVTLDDGTSLKAELKGSNASADIAVLKVDERSFRTFCSLIQTETRSDG